MKKVFLLLTAALAIIVMTNCAFLSRVNVMMPDQEYNPLRIDNLRSDEPLIIQGPFLDEAIKEPVYIVTDGYVKLHKELWKKTYPESKDAEGVTRSRLLIQYTDYPTKYKGDDVIFSSAWKVRAELVEFVEECIRGKKVSFVPKGTLYYPDFLPLTTYISHYISQPCPMRAVSYYTAR